MSIKEATTLVRIHFHFDPLCPLAWRTALWVREVRQTRPIDIQWRFFSLEVVNRKEGTEPDYVSSGWAALRTLALARRQKGNEAVEKLYVALGDAQHGRKESIREREGVAACAERAGLGATFVEAALNDESTIQDVLNDHQEAVRLYHAFGVPTIAIEDSHVGFYGPIINTVPHGEEATELWDYTAWVLKQPNIFELKRDRKQVQWGSVSTID